MSKSLTDSRNLEDIREQFLAEKILPTIWLGDSASRFDDYTKYAQGCETILELGVYTGLTTTAFLLANPKKLISIDHTASNFSIRHQIEYLAEKQGTEFHFLEMNDLDYESSGQDLLLIDTTHFYDQTLKELERFGGLTRQRIVLHDCASHDGVMKAVCDWLFTNKEFYISLHDNRGDGVCVLQRYPKLQ
ncbi:MAG: hypothetical protein P4N59_03020 [Negativicutes bacterium]|nr:hypothetical protein [Negativicutes bacterium]